VLEERTFRKESAFKLLSSLFVVVLLVSSIAIQPGRSQEDFTVTVGQDRVFTACNYHVGWISNNPDWPTKPLPPSRAAVSDGNTAQVSLSTNDENQDGVATANVGVQFQWNFGSYAWQDVKDWPITMTLVFSYEIGAYWGTYTGSANAGVRIRNQNGQLYDYDWTGFEINNPGTISNSVNYRISTTVGALENWGKIIYAQVACEAGTAPGAAVNNHSFASVTISSVTIDFESYTPVHTTSPSPVVTPKVTVSPSPNVTVSPSISPSPETSPSTQTVSFELDDVRGNKINSANIGEPYVIAVTINNPDSVAHTYDLQLAVNSEWSATFPRGGVRTDRLPEWLVATMAYAGVPTGWNANPSSVVHPAASQTVAPGATATFRFAVLSRWNWIPPWDSRYLLSCLLWGFYSGFLPTDVSLIKTMFELGGLASFSNAMGESGWFLSGEQFNFVLTVNSVDKWYIDGIPVFVPVLGYKMNNYLAAMIAGAAAAEQTFEAIAPVITGSGTVIAVAKLLNEAILIFVQNLDYVAALDPSSDYARVVQPVPFSLNNGTLLLDLPAVHSLTAGEVQVLSTLAQLVSLQNATTESIIRYAGAIDAGSEDSANLQLQALTSYAKQRDSYLSNLESELSLLGSEASQLNSSSVLLVQNYLQQNGLPSIERQILSGLGFESSVEDVSKSLALFNASSLGGFNLTNGVNALVSAGAAETDFWSNTKPVVLPTPSQGVTQGSLLPNSVFYVAAVGAVVACLVIVLGFMIRAKRRRATSPS
jgi:hypothetical protein